MLDWRLDDISLRGGPDGPLPWLPRIPDRVAADPEWGPYLAVRSQLVAQLADQVRRNTAAETPSWAAQLHTLLPAELITELQVWRAATQVEPGDQRPTGPRQLDGSARIFQQRLEMRLAAADTNAKWRWQQLLAREVPCVTPDPFLPELAERLSDLTRAGFDATLLVRPAAAAGPLPDDHPAAALWWRILDQIPARAPSHSGATS